MTEALSGRGVAKDAVSRITARLEEVVQAWRAETGGGVPLPRPRRHLPQGQLGREGSEHGPTGGRGRGGQCPGLPGVVLLAVEAAPEEQAVAWQGLVHFERNVLAHIPEQAKEEVAAGLRAVLAVAVRRKETAERLAQEFLARWGEAFPKAVELFSRGLKEAF